RLHPAGKSDTLGQFLILIGLGFQLIDGSGSLVTDYAAAPGMAAIKIFLIIVVIFVTAPTATHAITKAAYLDGLQPWTGDEDVNGVDGIKSDTQDERAEQEKAGDQQ
ncbi:MAG: monovalent cation/H(+) antiporter subunit G, partial [Planctomycetes bacterium]|nr:monovalent cation/H(+) antiporter subunit G [Planctomycetota bacterium]